MNTATQTISLHQSYWSKRTPFDWVYAVLVLLGTAFAFNRYNASMDIYEKWILVGTAPAMI